MYYMFYNKKEEMRGFTLLEMLVTISIIGILASVVITGLSGTKERARDAERISDIAQLQLVLEQYFNACRQYPATLTTGANNSSSGTCSVTLGTFLPTIPTPPMGGNYAYGVKDTAPVNTDYRLGVVLETNDPVLAGDVDGGVTYGVTCADDATNFRYCVRP